MKSETKKLEIWIEQFDFFYGLWGTSRKKKIESSLCNRLLFKTVCWQKMDFWSRLKFHEAKSRLLTIFTYSFLNTDFFRPKTLIFGQQLSQCGFENWYIFFLFGFSRIWRFLFRLFWFLWASQKRFWFILEFNFWSLDFLLQVWKTSV
jgi:hypothetical protein